MSKDPKHMHPKARAAWDKACEAANLWPVITQTMGNAPDSKGTHDADGSYKDPKTGEWIRYSAATDVSVNQLAWSVQNGKRIKVKMTEARIKWFLYNLALQGFAAWYRYQAAFASKHMHIVYAGVKMKPSLQSQVRDFWNDKTGLASHGKETFWTADASTDAKIRKLFEAAN